MSSLSLLKTHYFDELHIGMTATMDRTVAETDVTHFANVSGDHNPLHIDPEFAANFDEHGGSMEIDYVVDMDHAVFGRNKFQMHVREQERQTI